jgi:hypothetical protein
MPESDPIAGLAVDLNEESKAKRRGRPPKNPELEPAPGTGAAAIAAMNAAGGDEGPSWAEGVNHRGPKPHFPTVGESWQEEPGGVVKWWHGAAWYLNKPGEPAVVGEQEIPPAEPESGEDSDLAAAADPSFARDDTDFEPVAFEVDEHEPAAFTAIGEAFDSSKFDARSLVQDSRDFVLQLYKDRPKPWAAMSEDEQRLLAANVENTMRDFVQGVVEAVASAHDHQPIRCTLESYNEKDGIKVSLKVAAFTEADMLAAVVGLHKARGKHVLVTVATADDFSVDRAANTDPDEPELLDGDED